MQKKIILSVAFLLSAPSVIAMEKETKKDKGAGWFVGLAKFISKQSAEDEKSRPGWTKSKKAQEEDSPQPPVDLELIQQDEDDLGSNPGDPE